MLNFLHLLLLSQEEAAWRGVYAPQELYTFPTTRMGESSSLKVSIRNNSANMHEVRENQITQLVLTKCKFDIFGKD